MNQIKESYSKFVCKFRVDIELNVAEIVLLFQIVFAANKINLISEFVTSHEAIHSAFNYLHVHIK